VRNQPNIADSTIRVEVGLLDRLMNLVGELVLTRNQILQFAGGSENKTITSSSQRLNLITTEPARKCHEDAHAADSRRVEQIPRVVRDVSHSLAKKSICIWMAPRRNWTDDS